MNARYKKEIRVLLPFLGITLVVVIGMSWLLIGNDAAGIVMVLFTGCCALMGAASFGVEFQSRTMLQLLAQPVSRRRLWFEKMLPLGTALLLGYLVMVLAVGYIIVGEGKPGDFGAFAGTAAMIAICAFCSGPAVTIMSRNFIGGIAFSILLPFTVVGIIAGMCSLIFYLTPQQERDAVELWILLHDRINAFLSLAINHHQNLCAAIPCAIYCMVIYRIGWRQFLRFQVVDGQTQEIQIKIPEKMRPALGALVNKLLPGYTGPVASLFRKELQLNRLSYFAAALFIILLPMMGIGWKLHPSEVTIGCFWALFAAYMVAIPVAVGVQSMAEERSWGTVAWQLTLPAVPRLQAFIKLFVSIATVVLLGLLLPALMLDVGKMFFHLPEPGVFTNPDFNYINLMFRVMPYGVCLAIILFASSCSTNSVRAIVLAGGLFVGGGLVVALGTYSTQRLNQFSFAPGPMGFICDLPFRAGHILAAIAAEILTGVTGVPHPLYGAVVELIFAGMFAIICVICFLTYLNCQKAELKRGRSFAQVAWMLVAIFFMSIILGAVDITVARDGWNRRTSLVAPGFRG